MSTTITYTVTRLNKRPITALMFPQIDARKPGIGRVFIVENVGKTPNFVTGKIQCIEYRVFARNPKRGLTWQDFYHWFPHEVEIKRGELRWPLLWIDASDLLGTREKIMQFRE